MTLEDALEWFGLDRATVTEPQLRQAYRRIAKELHPDTKLSFIDKLAAHDNFVMAIEARDMIAKALHQEALGRTVQGTKSEWVEETESSHQNNNTYKDTLTGRAKFDFHNPRPFERLMEVPVVGSIVGAITALGYPRKKVLLPAGATVTPKPFVIELPSRRRYTVPRGFAFLKVRSVRATVKLPRNCYVGVCNSVISYVIRCYKLTAYQALNNGKNKEFCGRNKGSTEEIIASLIT